LVNASSLHLRWQYSLCSFHSFRSFFSFLNETCKSFASIFCITHISIWHELCLYLHNLFFITCIFFISICATHGILLLSIVRQSSKQAGSGTKDETTKHMKTYDETLNAVVRYIVKNGKTQDTLDKLETMLPGAWASNLIADALDILAAR
jgi:hypothetical protein